MHIKTKQMKFQNDLKLALKSFCKVRNEMQEGKKPKV